LKGNLANFLSNRGRLREAIAICEGVLETLPPMSDAGGRARVIQNTTRILADALRRLGFPQRAVETLEVLANSAPAGQDTPVLNVIVEVARAQALLDLGRSEACDEALRHASAVWVAKNIQDPVARARMVGLQVRVAIANDALADAVAAWSARNDGCAMSERDVIEDEARLALACGDAVKACQIAERGLDLNSLSDVGTRAPYQRFELLLVLAKAKLASGDVDSALEHALEAVRLNGSFADVEVSPDRIRALAIVAQIHMARGALDEAKIALTEAGAIRDRNVELGPHILADFDLLAASG